MRDNKNYKKNGSYYQVQHLKDQMTEEEMEKYLIENDMDVDTNFYDEEGCIDSTVVIELAIDLGYKTETISEYNDFIFIKKHKEVKENE